MIDRLSLKQRAWDLCKVSKPSLVAAGAIFCIISLIINSLSTRLIGANISEHDAQQVLSAYANGNYDYIMNVSSELTPSSGASLLNLLLKLLMEIISFGFLIFVANSVRGTGAVYANLLDGFGYALKIILLFFFEGLFIVLWSLLLLFPGVIAAYSYRQARFILMDNPDMSVFQCLKESKRMMKGHKWELFGFDLSFLGWGLLAAIIPLARIWTAPYITSSRFMYYEALKGEADYFNFA